MEDERQKAVSNSTATTNAESSAVSPPVNAASFTSLYSSPSGALQWYPYHGMMYPPPHYDIRTSTPVRHRYHPYSQTSTPPLDLSRKGEKLRYLDTLRHILNRSSNNGAASNQASKQTDTQKQNKAGSTKSQVKKKTASATSSSEPSNSRHTIDDIMTSHKSKINSEVCSKQPEYIDHTADDIRTKGVHQRLSSDTCNLEQSNNNSKDTSVPPTDDSGYRSIISDSSSSQDTSLDTELNGQQDQVKEEKEELLRDADIIEPKMEKLSVQSGLKSREEKTILLTVLKELLEKGVSSTSKSVLQDDLSS